MKSPCVHYPVCGTALDGECYDTYDFKKECSFYQPSLLPALKRLDKYYKKEIDACRPGATEWTLAHGKHIATKMIIDHIERGENEI